MSELHEQLRTNYTQRTTTMQDNTNNTQNQISLDITAWNLRCIRIPKETAQLLKQYCMLQNKPLIKTTTNILEKELANFKKQLEKIKDLKLV